jgi:hypothetical protein
MDEKRIREKYNQAREGLAANVTGVFGYDTPVLIEGAEYRGIWLECGPHEGLVYGRFDPDTAKANHEIFFHHQREDGYLPCNIKADRLGTSQIQEVVPIAETALEVAELTGDDAFLAKAYDAAAKWDDWLARNRDTRGTGLREVFCEYDTGHDNSPRFAGLPRKCPGDDAAVCPKAGKLPYLAPDLSATACGTQNALAAMAKRLGKRAEADQWREKAEAIRERILTHCYDPEDECFYDVDVEGRFVRIRGDALLRVLCQHVADQDLFERIYNRHIKNPEAFWPAYPLPSIALNDPAFVRELPPNSWGGASQALTALRAPRWFGHYGKEGDLRILMERWVEAILRADGFMQQMDPRTGNFIPSSGSYSPAMCVFIDFVDRLGKA